MRNGAQEQFSIPGSQTGNGSVDDYRDDATYAQGTVGEQRKEESFHPLDVRNAKARTAARVIGIDVPGGSLNALRERVKQLK